MTDLKEFFDVVLPLLVLAVVQGVTEFLPVSSSGHLAIGQWLMGVGEGSLVDDVVLHAGTLVAVLFFYRADILELLRNATASAGDARRYLALIVLANVPAGIIGIGFKDQIEQLFDSPIAVLAAMTATAAVLWWTRRLTRGEAEINAKKALLIGLAQAFAILPGASRSGFTIATALALGLRPVDAARFSFLMSIPAIAGATLLQAMDADPASLQPIPLALGFVVAAAVGLLCLRWLVALVRRMALHRFAPYLLGVVFACAVALSFGVLQH